jgi:hypothetical protein
MKTKIPAHWPQQNVDDWPLLTQAYNGALLSFPMPNGKTLGECTFGEVGLVAQIIKEYAEERRS